MIDPYEQLVALRLLANLGRGTRQKDSFGPWAFEFLQGRGSSLGLPVGTAAAAPTPSSTAFEFGVQQCNLICELMDRRISSLADPPISHLESNLRAVAAALSLSEIDTRLLGVFVRYRVGGPVEDLLDALGLFFPRADVASFFSVIPLMIGVLRTDVSAALEPSSRLISSGLLTVTPQGIHTLGKLIHVVRMGALSESNVRDQLLGAPSSTELEWQDFDHIAADRDQISKTLQGAADSDARGVHVLVYGPPGTGKTEFCKVLATRVEVPIFQIGEVGDSGLEPQRMERIAAYRLAQSLLGPRSSALVLVDEMEDVFETHPANPHGGVQAPAGSSVFMNRLLEQSLVPTLWTANDISHIRPAVLRRMTYAVELRIPSRPARSRIWRRAMESQRLSVADSELDTLAREFEVSPAVSTNSVRAANLAGGGVAEMRRAAAGVAKAMNGGVPLRAHTSPAVPIHLGLFNANPDLAELAEDLARHTSTRNFSICLYGPPGTGKSAFARYLADRLGIEFLQKRTSDLLSPWVGESEANIARAFDEARSTGALLMFDEADSLLYDRRDTRQSWQVTQVNEMLTQMDEHRLPFICATNMFERLDHASVRRFTFKVELGYLRANQIGPAFRLFFGVEAPSSWQPRSLTPGDFASIAKRMALTDGLARMSPDRLASLLVLESSWRKPHLIGFGRSARSGMADDHCTVV